MNKLLKALLVSALSVVLVSPAFAGVKDRHINREQRHQGERIAQGVKSGELNKQETKDLVGDQRQIRREERQDKADGHFTKAERQDVRQDQADASKEIYQDKHN